MKKITAFLLLAALIMSLCAVSVFAVTSVERGDLTITGLGPQVYTGREITPKLTVSYRGIQLTEGKDYTVAYSNNYSANTTASVEITFKGSYTGKVETSFYIMPAGGGTSAVIGAITGVGTTAANTITIGETSGGTIICENKKAIAAASIGFTVKPDAGNRAETVGVSATTGKAVSVIDKGNGNYSFKMPNDAVVIYATFVPDNGGVTTVIQPDGVRVSVSYDGLTPVTPTDIDGNPIEPAPQEPEKPQNPFTDIKESDYFYAPVLWAVEKGVTTGTTATTFSPTQTCTRGQTVTFLWRAAGSPEPTKTENPFKDVKESDYFYKAVLWAVENNITTGTTKTTFAPKDNCTRAQVVTFLWRASGSPQPGKTASFKDVAAGQYYTDPVSWAVEKGITTGTTATEFAPKANCVRAQIVTFLYRNYNG